MKRMLRPEHVERLSDTQLRITLPPCPDFDIEEDEQIEVWIPPQLLVKGTTPLFAGTFTINADSYEERIDHAIQGLAEERTELGPNSRLATFLLTFFTSEIVAKALVSHAKYRGTGRKTPSNKWSTNDMTRALKTLGIDFDRASVDAIFSTESALASEMSARALRDNVTHRMKRIHRQAVRDRYPALMETMERFLHAVSDWRNQHRSGARSAP